jgi:hypothetical protein
MRTGRTITGLYLTLPAHENMEDLQINMEFAIP